MVIGLLTQTTRIESRIFAEKTTEKIATKRV